MLATYRALVARSGETVLGSSDLHLADTIPWALESTLASVSCNVDGLGSTVSVNIVHRQVCRVGSTIAHVYHYPRTRWVLRVNVSE
jgi:hypothetical protein